MTFLQLDYNYLLPLTESALPTSSSTTITTDSNIPPAPSTTESDESNNTNTLPMKSIMENAFNHLTVLIYKYTHYIII